MRMRIRSYHVSIYLAMQLLSLLLVSTCFAAGLKTGKSTFWVVWNNGWRFLNFGILIYFLVKWLKEPLASFLKSYRELISKEIESAENAEKKAEKEYEEVQKRLEELDSEIARMHELAVKQGTKEKEKIIADARMHAEGIIERAKITAYMMVEDAKKKLREELVEMIITTAEDKISKSINEQDHQRLIESYVETIVKAPPKSASSIT